jgi:glyoxylase-like metal-dependent hydrolase (beta-lactamase superfamily II)
MTRHICETCGVEYPDAPAPPESCPICLDERQYVGWHGQRWTSIEKMRADGYRNVVREEEPGLLSIGTQPNFAIGQRALLVRHPSGNVLWDCISYLDDETVDAVRAVGGIRAIAVSHPHFYASYVEWSEAFDAPVYLHEADREWAVFGHPNVVYWTGDSIEPLPGVTVVKLGGHFDGATVLHWPTGASGRGAVLSGDTLQVVMDRRFVSFMYSFPNLIPLSAATVAEIARRMRPYRYDRVYGAWPGRVVAVDGAQSVERSAARYIEQLQRGSP